MSRSASSMHLPTRLVRMQQSRCFSSTPFPLASRDHYTTLGVRRTASPTEIKLAFRKLAKQFHPDVSGSSSEVADQKFKAISEAYTVLSDSKLRRDYDNVQGSPFSSASPSGSSYYSTSRPSSTSTHAWQDYRKHHPRWKSAHGPHRNPFEHHRAQQQQHQARSRDAADDLFERMHARYQKAGNLWGTQERLRREAAERAAWEKSQGSETSTTLRVSQFFGVIGTIWLIVSFTRVSAEERSTSEV